MAPTVSKPKQLAMAMSIFLVTCGGPSLAADLDRTVVSVPVADQWTFNFTPYGWATWMSGDMTVSGRSFGVQATPAQIVENLDWSSLPVWMSYAEARSGRFGVFNDIVYASLAGSTSFARPRGILTGTLSAKYDQATVEFGGTYEVAAWPAEASRGGIGGAAVDVLVGGRYWHQDVDLSLQAPRRTFARSGSVSWVDPFVGARLRYRPALGQEFLVRGDIGGFGVGSNFSWQLQSTYSWQLRSFGSWNVNAFLGYKALSVDYEQGSGNTAYRYNVIQHGPITGLTFRF